MKHTELVAEMRDIATRLEKINTLYLYDQGAGSWSPNSLRYEAKYLSENP